MALSSAYTRLLFERLDWATVLFPIAIFICSAFFLARTALRRGNPSLPGRVKKLFIFPVKSCAGIEVESAVVTPSGLKGGRLNSDRAWAIVRLLDDEAREDADYRLGEKSFGRGLPLYEPVTIRSHPNMVLIKPSFGKDGNGELCLHLPDGDSIEVPLITGEEGTSSQDSDSARAEQPNSLGLLRCIVWNSICYGRDQGDDVSAALSRYLNSKKPLRLVHMGHQHLRSLHLDAKYGELEVKHPKRVARFSDWSTFNVLSTQSVDWVNARIPWSCEETDPQTYRPNILVDAPYAFWEDSLQVCCIGGTSEEQTGTNGVSFQFAKHCGRCTLPTINRHTGKRSKELEPLRTLKKYRTNFYPHLPRKDPVAFLGVNMNFMGLNGSDDKQSGPSEVTVRVGDTVTPVKNMTPPKMLLGRQNPWGPNYY